MVNCIEVLLSASACTNISLTFKSVRRPILCKLRKHISWTSWAFWKRFRHRSNPSSLLGIFTQYKQHISSIHPNIWDKFLNSSPSSTVHFECITYLTHLIQLIFLVVMHNMFFEYLKLVRHLKCAVLCITE